MYYQNKAGFYVYFYKDVYYGDYHTTKIDHTYSETLDGLFWCWNERGIRESVGYSINDRICKSVVGKLYRRTYSYRYLLNEKICGKINCKEHNEGYDQARVVYDHNGNLYTPDRLIGLYRKWRQRRTMKNRWSRRNGVKKGSWGGYRGVRTLQERKWANAWDDEELAPKVRGRRSACNIPDSWDDIQVHSDKSWKTQTKRKHQWKENNVKL